MLVLQLVMNGIDGGLQSPPAVPFDNSMLGRKLGFYLECLLMPGGAEIPAQFVVDAVAAGRAATVASAFDEAIQAGYMLQLVHILQRVKCISNEGRRPCTPTHGSCLSSSPFLSHPYQAPSAPQTPASHDADMPPPSPVLWTRSSHTYKRCQGSTCC